MIIFRICLITAALSLLFIQESNAQMFSVESKKKTPRANTNYSQIYGGLTQTNFNYNGDVNSINQDRFNFTDNIYFIAADLGGLLLDFQFARDIGNQEDLQFIQFELEFQNRFRVYRNKYFSVNLPLNITSDSFALSSNDNSLTNGEVSRYEQTGFTIGTGLNMKFNYANFILNGEQLFRYGFAARGFGAVNGSKTLYESNLSFLTPPLYSNSRLSLNFSYLFHDYDLDGSDFDYELSGLRYGIGFTF